MSIKITRQNNYTQSDKVTFTATPRQILKAVKGAKGICSGKKAFLENLAKDFKAIEKEFQQKEYSSDLFEYKLGQTNNLPEALEDTTVGSCIKYEDKHLNKQAFKCSGNDNCKCGKGLTLGEFAAKLLKTIGVENPDVITIAKAPEKHFSLFGWFKNSK